MLELNYIKVFFFNETQIYRDCDRADHRYCARARSWPICYPPSFFLAFLVFALPCFLVSSLSPDGPTPFNSTTHFGLGCRNSSSVCRTMYALLYRVSVEVNSARMCACWWVSRQYFSCLVSDSGGHRWQLISLTGRPHIAPAKC